MIFYSQFLCSWVFAFAGKRPRDLLNPKAIKYMQSIFSIKDAITKKESRQLSAQFGVTVSQVIVCLVYFFIWECYS